VLTFAFSKLVQPLAKLCLGLRFANLVSASHGPPKSVGFRPHRDHTAQASESSNDEQAETVFSTSMLSG
jgi:hypothetical protein